MSIRILPQHLANQIAAGEVVQRPESVVKELVENAVDAGASTITVVVREAGKQLVHVIDDGCGLSEDDARLSIVRHATSKIVTEADLQAIRTLGFRGEALASIAAVADVEIRTRRTADDMGTMLQSRPGAEPTVLAVATDVGTQVLVRNLFYNVPARRKFLKTDLTEFRHISETMQKMALARPDLRFTFHDGNILVFDVRASDLRRRISDILGIDAQRTMIPVDAEEQGIHVSGFVGNSSVSRQSRSGQFLFLNGRPINSRQLGHAVASAYEHVLDQGQHATFVLNIQADPARIDVNVHPQKHEVKFDDERTVYLLMQNAVSAALQKANVIPSFVMPSALAAQPLQSLPTSGDGFVNRYTGEIHASGFSPPGFSPPPALRPFPQHAPGMQARPSAAAMLGLHTLLSPMRDDTPAGAVQVAGRYVLSPSLEGIVVVDQRAAHERIMYERAMGLASAASEQALLFAVRISVAPSRAALLREMSPELHALGFRFDVHPDGTADVHAVPSDVAAGSEELVLEEILQSLEQGGRLPLERRREGVAAAFAARQALRRGERLTAGEAQVLVRDLFACTVPHISPGGQPTYIIISMDELERRFS